MLVCLSESYPEKDWPAFEFEVGKEAAHKRTDEYLLPLALTSDIPKMVGLPGTVAHLSTDELSLEQIADALVDKLVAPDP
jgi:hypothetical protein